MSKRLPKISGFLANELTRPYFSNAMSNPIITKNKKQKNQIPTDRSGIHIFFVPGLIFSGFLDLGF